MQLKMSLLAHLPLYMKNAFQSQKLNQNPKSKVPGSQEAFQKGDKDYTKNS